jgi:hypothetical protein
LVGRVDVLNGFEAPFDIINKRGTKKKKGGFGSLTTAHAVGGRRARGAAFRGRQWSVDGVHKERAQQHAWPPRWGITSRPALVWGPKGVGGCADPRNRPTFGPQHAAADLERLGVPGTANTIANTQGGWSNHCTPCSWAYWRGGRTSTARATDRSRTPRNQPTLSPACMASTISRAAPDHTPPPGMTSYLSPPHTGPTAAN